MLLIEGLQVKLAGRTILKHIDLAVHLIAEMARTFDMPFQKVTAQMA